jgi:glycerol uptake facilitator protein
MPFALAAATAIGPVPLAEVFGSEVLGTALLTLLGCGVVANVVLNRTLGNAGGWLLVNVGWGFAVLAGVYAAWKSGAHINPAVTVGILASGAQEYAPGVDVSAGSTLTYVVAQLLGAFLGAVVAWLAYKKHFDVHEGAEEATDVVDLRDGGALDRPGDGGGGAVRGPDGSPSGAAPGSVGTADSGGRRATARVAERELTTTGRGGEGEPTPAPRTAPAGAADKLGVFATGPAIPAPAWNVLTEVVGTFVLVLVVLLFGRTPSGLGPAAVAFLVVGIGASLGGPTGYAINPARDLGPRIAHALLPIRGKGGSNWGYAWVPIVGPIIGAVLAGLLFRVLT